MVHKVFKSCRTIYNEGTQCPQCGSQEFSTEIKGKVVVLDVENSEIAKNLKYNKKGTYAVRA